ncbi:UPF0496 protein At3g19330-like [Salvia splendens]|uniref:UPF0496 protein At3g19330-like n=1 Tax=Salvia splendens TaxID=180675 RepID=UPI001C272031|nr:UPF0496 protein At3g19330-like [Salvia splendens]XP_041998265.1 UPF0496 protein At3g19330-like [Salvia splendens]
MLSCLKTLPPPSTTSYFSSPATQGDSVENTPTSSAQTGHIDLTREYTIAVQTSSYGEIRRTFDQDSSFDQTVVSGHLEGIEGDQLLEQVLQPSRECVQETLSIITPSPLTDLVATYFEHSEETSRFCFLLYQKVSQARLAYAPIHHLLEDLPLEFDSNSYSLSDSLCNLAYNVFLQFDRLENPFLSHASQNFDNMRQRFSQLTHELDRHPVKPRSKVHLPRYCSAESALCLVAVAVGVAITAVAIATHALVALAGSPLCFALFPSNMIKKKRCSLVQVDEASRSAYVLLRDLDTIDRLVAHLNGDVENDKFSIRHALERDIDKYLIHEVLKQLRRNRPSFMERLAYLEDNLFLCFAAINRTRARVLEKIHPQER